MSFTAFNGPPAKVAPTIVHASPSTATKNLLQSAFADRADLLKGLNTLALSDERLVQDLSSYVLTLKRSASTAVEASSSAQVSKKRKIDETFAASNGSGPGWADQSIRASHTTGDVSFSMPIRKKLRLEWVNSSPADLTAGGVRALSAGGDIEFGVSWKDIDQIFSMPVPEKTKRQHNFIILPTNAYGLLPVLLGAPGPILWTVFEPGPKDVDAPSEPAHTTALLNAQLAPFGKKVVFPDPNEFESAIKEPHRKSEAAYHVKAHLGAKDGYLYFLPPGILFAFKKPLLFLPYSAIDSISYTSVLARTFNLNINTSVSSSDGEDRVEEIEFSMLDQADFNGINEYVERHGLKDASMAQQRKAQKFDVNKGKGVKKEEGNGVVEEEENGDGLTEIQRAEMALQDEEDEEEEDYVDEGSEDGSGSEDDEDEDGGGGGAGEDEEEEDDDDDDE